MNIYILKMEFFLQFFIDELSFFNPELLYKCPGFSSWPSGQLLSCLPSPGHAHVGSWAIRGAAFTCRGVTESLMPPTDSPSELCVNWPVASVTKWVKSSKLFLWWYHLEGLEAYLAKETRKRAKGKLFNLCRIIFFIPLQHMIVTAMSRRLGVRLWEGKNS